MKRFSQQFKKQGERITMRASERDELRARLVSYMEYHPLPSEMKAKAPRTKMNVKGITSEPFFTFSFNPLYTRSFAGVFMLFVILGVPALAERAVPGDVLYPVKVQFNEEVRSTLSLSPYAKVEWETQRLERRISEARLLASEGRLTDEAETAVAEAVKTHTDAAQREIAELRETDSEGAAIAEIAFASALAVQSEVLEGHMGNEGTVETGDYSVVALADVVAKARTSAESAQTVSAVSYEKLLATIEQESTRVYELFTSVKGDATPEEVVDVERRLADVKRKVAYAIALKEGTPVTDGAQVVAMALSMTQDAVVSNVETLVATTALASSTDVLDAEEKVVAVEEVVEVSVPQTEEEKKVAEVEAIASLRVTLTDIQKLLNYLSHIDVRENVSIEDLVPVVPTTEEKVEEVVRMYDEVKAIVEKVEGREIPSRLVAKVAHIERMITVELKKVTVFMEKGDVDSARSLVDSARNLAADLDVLTSNEPVKDEVDTDVVDEESATTTEEVVE